MDYFLSTYKKDFKWPTINMVSKEKKLVYEKERKSTALQDTVPCIQESAQEQSIKSYSGSTKGNDSYQTSSKYLEKLFNKYPYLRNVMKYTNTDEMAKKILSEKYKTTYQIEYNKDEMHPANNYAQTMAVLETAENMHREKTPDVEACTTEGVAPIKCTCAQGLSYVPCRCAKDAPVRRIAWKPAPISKIPQAPKEKKKKKEQEDRATKAAAEGQKKLKPFCTEYNDTISKVGGIIIKKKLLYKETVEETK